MKFFNINKSHLRISLFTFIGHFLELYDYTIFVVLLPIIAPIFFPASNLSASINIGMIVFAVSICISVPGSLFWGKMGDKIGRLVMLRRSIMMMGLPSLIIALLPTYEQVGIVAPMALFTCRLIQTFSASGELNGGRIFITEHFGNKHIGKITGFFSCMGALGVLLAMLLGWIINTYSISWRIPFFLGSSLAIVGMFLRRKIAESPEFIKFSTAKNISISSEISTFRMLKINIKKVMTIFAITAVLGTLSYMMHGFINPFLISQGVDKAFAYQMSIIGLLTCGMSSIFFGYLIDKYNNERLIINLNFIAVILLIPIGFLLIHIYLISNSIELLYLTFVLFGGLLGMNVSAAGTINFKLFAPENRCRGIIISYSISMAIFGGLTPITLKTMSEVDFFAPSFTVSMVALVAYYIYCYNRR